MTARRMRDDVEGCGGAAAEVTKRTPTEIAADAAARSEEIRRATYREDVSRWRAIVFKIAGGDEPTGEELRDIAGLAERLKLPEGSLAVHVHTVAQEHQLAGQLDSAQKLCAQAEQRQPLLQKELEEAARRLNDLRGEAASNFSTQANPGYLRHRLGEHRDQAPLLFCDLDSAVKRMIKAEAANGRATR
jgi:hypothetical protein